ncbi:DUF3784 domain-containing protein [uncultured Winogradskyella sp.]|uniref:DUF3784 domain-containing protein n=1 Tax=uncultured Winogradskyella sp. TaxID=395353 RepID=UPI002601800C|nr:DUF3784 domain-containing protein [uncultured Winogradskyella sp.]|tara:strand:- start:58 stop:366 length:309 start_codon:yes stop_codon:yes gene_type:complete
MLFISILFIVLGTLIKYGKMYFLIAGYNTMSKEKQKNYDIEGIAAVFRNAMFGMALIMLIGLGLSHWLEIPKLEDYVFFGALTIGVPYILMASNSDKFKLDK